MVVHKIKEYPFRTPLGPIIRIARANKREETGGGVCLRTTKGQRFHLIENILISHKVSPNNRHEVEESFTEIMKGKRRL